jgi:hypothetical protein
VEVHHTHEVGQHARIERRTTEVWSLPAGEGTGPWHDHFRTLIEVHRHTEVFDTRCKDWKERQERVYYLSTVDLSAAQYTQAIRDHWGDRKPLALCAGCQPG